MRKLCKTENFVSNPKNYLIFLKSVVLDSGLPREGWGFNPPPPRNPEGPPKSCQTQPDCENS